MRQGIKFLPCFCLEQKVNRTNVAKSKQNMESGSTHTKSESGAHIIVEKLKARQFFKSGHLPRLRAAVLQHHYITSYATLLLKAFFIYDIFPLWDAYQRRAPGATLPSALNVVYDSVLIEDAFTIVRGKPLQYRSHRGSSNDQSNDERRVDSALRSVPVETKSTTKTKKTRAQRKLETRQESKPGDVERSDDLKARRWWRELLRRRWKATFVPSRQDDANTTKKAKKSSDATFAPGLDPKNSISMSHSLAYAAEQLTASYETNIVEHYPAYVKRFVHEALVRLSTVKYVKAQATKAADDVLLQRLGAEARCQVAEYNDWVERYRELLIPSQPNAYRDLAEHLSTRPWEFLPYMVRINTMLESLPAVQGRQPPRLFSPLVMRKSFVPGHMTIDTSALVHMFFEGMKEIDEFKAFYKLVYDVDLVKLDSKAALAASFATLTGRKDVSKEDESRHAQRLWEYVCRLDPSENKHATRVLRQERPSKPSSPFRFGRMVRTDGYNVSVVMTTAPDTLGRKRIAKTKQVELPHLNEDTASSLRQRIMPLLSSGDAILISCDPGKKKIATLCDDHGRVLTYTQARRERECRFKQTSERLANASFFRVLQGLSLRWTDSSTGQDTVLISPSVSDVTSKYLSRFNSKTCRADDFAAYVKARMEVEKHLRPFYESGFLRHQKYSIYLAKKASEDRFIDKIRNTFGGAKRSTDKQKAIFIAWGNWGRRPNALRGMSSSPGIGFRRRIHQRLTMDRRSSGIVVSGGTLTTFEGMTSSCCHSCGGTVSPFVDEQGNEHYRALMCGRCRKIWNRDVLGASNILACGRCLLEHGHRPEYLAARRMP